MTILKAVKSFNKAKLFAKENMKIEHTQIPKKLGYGCLKSYFLELIWL